jgi:hypothetical protein
MAKQSPLSYDEVARPQPQGTIKSVTIRSLYSERGYYENYPIFQRGKVWLSSWKPSLIDSILKGYPVPPILTMMGKGSDGKNMHLIVDGQQRLSTVFEYRENKFATYSIPQSRKEEPNSFIPVEPKKKYSQLSDEAREVFDEFAFSIVTLKDVDEVKAGVIFRRLQHQQPLQAAEKLASYKSRTRDYALELASDPFWTKFYQGDKNRKQLFQASLWLIIMEHAQTFSSLKGRRATQYASGTNDAYITPQLIEAVKERLDVVETAFHGTTFVQYADIIPMYQATILFEQQGHTFRTSSEKGCLTNWFGQIQIEAELSKKTGVSYPLMKLAVAEEQRDFWEKNFPIALEQCKEKSEAVA